MKAPAIDALVYSTMFPKPKASDPQNFHAVLTRYLIYEVRQEVHAFYGHLDTQEAKYPGLDYNHPTHRIRLCRWQWHRRLFRAMNALRLTPGEISTLTRWEGTRWAKERFEKEQGVVIRDTAADGIPEWREEQRRVRVRGGQRREVEAMDVEVLAAPEGEEEGLNVSAVARQTRAPPEAELRRELLEESQRRARQRHNEELRRGLEEAQRRREQRHEEGRGSVLAHSGDDAAGMEFRGGIDFTTIPNPLTTEHTLSDFDFDSFLHDPEPSASSRPFRAHGRNAPINDPATQSLLRALASDELDASEDEIIEAETEEIITEPHPSTITTASPTVPTTPAEAHNDPSSDDDEDETFHSIGVSLNARLRERVAAHNAGDTSLPIDEAWEQWLKNALETGELEQITSYVANSPAFNVPGLTLDPPLASRARGAGGAMRYEPYLFTATMYETARAGNWGDVPEFLHDMFRRRLSGEEGRQSQVARRSYSDLRAR